MKVPGIRIPREQNPPRQELKFALVSKNTCPAKAVNRQALEISDSLPPGSTPKSAHAVSGKPEPAAK